MKNNLSKLEELLETGKDDPEPIPKIYNKLRSQKIENMYCHSDVHRAYEYPIFSMEDWIAYTAVLQFYLQNYDQALETLKVLESALLLQKTNYFDSDNSIKDPAILMEIFDFRFSPMTLNECYFNQILAFIGLEKYKEAIKIATLIIETAKPNLKSWIIFIRAILYETIGNKEKCIF